MSVMPVIFLGHGSPLIAIEQNDITKTWEQVGRNIPKPKAILAISAHWFGNSNRVQSAEKPNQIFDMYGFPKALYEVRYEPKGDKTLSERVQTLLKDDIEIDDSWGIDHGTWSVLVHMFPHADIPVVQLAINMGAPRTTLLDIGRKLKPLRDEGCLVLGSGNIVHNLRRVEWNRTDGTEAANRFDDWVEERIRARDFTALADYQSHPDGSYAVPTTDHYIPLLYVLGMVDSEDRIDVVNRVRQMGSLSMTGYVFSR